MPLSLVITVIGPDRPGLVESLSRVINEHGGNWTHSRMAHLGGQFAGMLLVTLDEDLAPALRSALDQLTGEALHITVAEDRPPTGDNSGDAPLTLKLDLVGQDRPGIVREISRILAAHGLNVEELATECESAPWSGELLFKTRATLSASPTADLDALRRDLESIAHDLMVEITLD